MIISGTFLLAVHGLFRLTILMDHLEHLTLTYNALYSDYSNMYMYRKGIRAALSYISSRLMAHFLTNFDTYISQFLLIFLVVRFKLRFRRGAQGGCYRSIRATVRTTLKALSLGLSLFSSRPL